MARTDAPGVMTGKPLIESDRVEGTHVYDSKGNHIGSIKRLMIEKMSGKVSYAVMSFGGFLGLGGDEHTIPWGKLRRSQGAADLELQLSFAGERPDNPRRNKSGRLARSHSRKGL